jgi:hypothetical protein
MPGYRSVVGPVGECHFCSRPIDIGEAWMEADLEGAHAVAHAACVYQDETSSEPHVWTRPAEPVGQR